VTYGQGTGRPRPPCGWEEGDASGYERRASATTPACGRGGVKDLALVVIMITF